MGVRVRLERVMVGPLFLSLCAVTCVGGCARQDAKPASGADTASGSGATSTAGARPPARVGRDASTNPGSVNILWLFTPRGLIVIDAGRNLAGGRRAVSALRDTRMNVLAIVLTHPHPDHVGGLGVLHEAFPQAPIFASKATADWMHTNPLGFYQLARRDDPDFPAQLTFPDHVIAPGEPIEVGEVRLETAEFGPGESATATAFYDPATGTLFAGDIVSNRFTPALLEGHTWSSVVRPRGRSCDARSERVGADTSWLGYAGLAGPGLRVSLALAPGPSAPFVARPAQRCIAA